MDGALHNYWISSPTLPGTNTYKQRSVRNHLKWKPRNVGNVGLNLNEGNANEPIKQNEDDSSSDEKDDEVITERKEYNLGASKLP